MPARDRYHHSVRNALVKDGWKITHDPLRLKWGVKDMYVDLGAERLLTAEKLGHKIAVEIKTFSGASDIADIEQAIGQYFLYLAVLNRTERERTLYLAIHEDVYLNIFEESLGKLLLEEYKIPLMIFELDREVILKWIPENTIAN
jgi:hypothetical protein